MRTSQSRKGRWIGNRKGQGTSEYALCLALLSVMCISVLAGFGHSVSGQLDRVATSVGQVANPASMAGGN